MYALDAALPYRYRKNPAWLGHIVTLNKIRRFGEGTTANAAYWSDLGDGRPPKLLGHPVYQASALDSTIVSGSNDDCLILGECAACPVRTECSAFALEHDEQGVWGAAGCR